MSKKSLVLCAAVVLLAGCGREEEPPPPQTPPPTTTPPTGVPAEPAPQPLPGETAPPPADTAPMTPPADTAPTTPPADSPSPQGQAPVPPAGDAGTTQSAAGRGEAVYKSTCAVCHAAGVAGAPRPGDKTDWGPRLAQGIDTLYNHAINGFQGSKGVMPPKGGNTTLPDEDVRAAVDYMAAQSQ